MQKAESDVFMVKNYFDFMLYELSEIIMQEVASIQQIKNTDFKCRTYIITLVQRSKVTN